MPKPSKPTFVVTLEALPDTDIPAVNRLRKFLKSALRSWNFRAVSITHDVNGRQREIPAEDEVSQVA